jgi:hypothetical protein
METGVDSAYSLLTTLRGCRPVPSIGGYGVSGIKEEMLVAAIYAEPIIPVSRLTTLEALSHICVSDSRQDVETLSRQADWLADTLRRHYFRTVKHGTQHRQAEVARLIIESKAAVSEARRALELEDMGGAVRSRDERNGAFQARTSTSSLPTAVLTPITVSRRAKSIIGVIRTTD